MNVHVVRDDFFDDFTSCICVSSLANQNIYLKIHNFDYNWMKECFMCFGSVIDWTY